MFIWVDLPFNQFKRKKNDFKKQKSSDEDRMETLVIKETIMSKTAMGSDTSRT